MAHYRKEHDLLGEREVPAEALWGIHTLRAVENFPLAGRPVHPALIHAYGTVKLACVKTNRALGAWGDDAAKADALEAACQEMAEGKLDRHIVVDSLQGGAGTSTNLNVNEVLANRALELLGEPLAATNASRPWTTSTATSPPTTPTPRPSSSPPSASCARSKTRSCPSKRPFRPRRRSSRTS